ncbi:MAG: hypothetical protein WC097_01515 [Eubacteriales bacterium]
MTVAEARAKGLPEEDEAYNSLEYDPVDGEALNHINPSGSYKNMKRKYRKWTEKQQKKK